jgi:hypothetical protein
VNGRCSKIDYKLLKDLHGMAVILSYTEVGNAILDTASPVCSHFAEDLEYALVFLAYLNTSHSAQ